MGVVVLGDPRGRSSMVFSGFCEPGGHGHSLAHAGPGPQGTGRPGPHECFIDGTFVVAKKGALGGENHAGQRFEAQGSGRRHWSPLAACVTSACPHEATPYKQRWKVERLFAGLGNVRRLVTRYEHKLENYSASVKLGCIILLRRYLRWLLVQFFGGIDQSMPTSKKAGPSVGTGLRHSIHVTTRQN
jgi:hypothetical protein